MKPFEEITIWERWNVKKKEFKHNHIIEGWSGLEAPLPANQTQAKNWKGAKWNKKYGYLKEGRVYEFGGKILGEAIQKQSPDKSKHFTTTYKGTFQGKFDCLDCSKDTGTIEDDYWIQDGTWLSVVPEWAGHLCLRCLRIRLDRDLQLSDFVLEYEVNSHINQKLLDRINNG